MSDIQEIEVRGWTGVIGFGVAMMLNLVILGSANGWQDVQGQAIEVQEIEVAEAAQLGVVMPFGEPGQILGAKQFSLNQIFALEIKRIESICELNESQSTKLKIGAKGTVKHLVEEFRNGDYLAQLGMAVEPNADGDWASKEIEIKEIKDANEVANYVWQIIDVGSDPSQMFTTTPPTKNLAWTKVVKGTLTEEQFQKYSQACESQEKGLRDATLDLGMKQLTGQLMLSDSQQAEFRKLVEAKADKFLNLPPVYSSFMFLFATASVKEDDLKKCLDETQFQRLKIMNSPMKEMVDMLEMELKQAEGGPADDAADDDEDDGK